MYIWLDPSAMAVTAQLESGWVNSGVGYGAGEVEVMLKMMLPAADMSRSPTHHTPLE